MEDVQLHRGHCVEVALENFDRLEVTRDVDQQPAPGKAWLIVDLNSREEVTVAIGVEELQEGLEPTKRADDGWRRKHRLAARDVDAITLVFSNRRNILSGTLAVNDQWRHLVVGRESGSECQNRASFEAFHKPEDPGL